MFNSYVKLPEGSRKEQISRQIQYIFADMAGWWLEIVKIVGIPSPQQMKLLF
jgi:hypothetical protein